MFKFSWMRRLLVPLLGLCLLVQPVGLAAPKDARTVHLTIKNTLVIEGTIEPLMVATYTAAIVGKRMLLPENEILYIVIASGGGDYQSSIILRDMIDTVPLTQVLCKFCASGAGMIFIGSAQRRIVIDSSQALMHELYLSHATAKNLNNPVLAASILKDSDDFNKMIYGPIGMSKKDYEAKITNKEWVVSGSDLVKLKMADELVKVTCDAFNSTYMPETCSQDVSH